MHVCMYAIKSYFFFILCELEQPRKGLTFSTSISPVIGIEIIHLEVERVVFPSDIRAEKRSSADWILTPTGFNFFRQSHGVLQSRFF
jgi:hypothetical protein